MFWSQQTRVDKRMRATVVYSIYHYSNMLYHTYHRHQAFFHTPTAPVTFLSFLILNAKEFLRQQGKDWSYTSHTTYEHIYKFSIHTTYYFNKYIRHECNTLKSTGRPCPVRPPPRSHGTWVPAACLPPSLSDFQK